MDTVERKPVFETLKKHGSSRLFLTAIIVSLLGSVFYGGYKIFSAITQFILSDNNSNFFSSITLLISACVGLVFACLVFYSLFTTYRFFCDKNENGYRIDFAVKMLGLSYIAECVFMAIDISFSDGDRTAITISVLILIAFALIYFLFYKGLRLSAEYPENALTNSPRGRISGFIIAILITVIIVYLGIVAFNLFMGIRAIFTSVTPETEIERAQQISDAIVNLINLLFLAPSMAGYAYYLKLIKRFRRDMNEAREEWAEIERKAKRSGL